MNTLQQTWETYVASWKVEEAAEKRALFANCLTSDCLYSDPVAQTSGWGELIGYMTNLHQQMPGAHFVTNYFQAHNNRCIAKWDLVLGDGTHLTDGVSFGIFNNEGKLVSMNGFYELPQA